MPVAGRAGDLTGAPRATQYRGRFLSRERRRSAMELAKAPAQLGALAAMMWTWTVAFLPRSGGAILIILVGFRVASWASRGVSR